MSDSELLVFLLARYDDEEATAHALADRQRLADITVKRALVSIALGNAALVDSEWGCCHSADEIRDGQCERMSVSEIVELQLLARLYVDHPDYRAEWRPDFDVLMARWSG